VLRAAAGSDGFRPSLAYRGTDVATLLALAAAGHGLTVLPAGALAGQRGVTGVRLSSPPLIHRTELIHATLASPLARDLATRLTENGPPG
jgi:DNA-binding transcriptional LysR family regulator